MARREPERTLIDEIIRLVYPLTPHEHDQLVEQMQQQWDQQPTQPLRVSCPMSQQVLDLASQLTAEEQVELLEELKLVWLRRALDQGEESLRKHGGIPAQEVFDRLRAKYEKRKTDSQ